MSSTTSGPAASASSSTALGAGGSSSSRAGATKTVTFHSLRREVPGDVPDKLIEWARTVQQRFGEELVDHGYNVVGFPAPINAGPETNGKGRKVDISNNVSVKDIFGWVLTAWGVRCLAICFPVAQIPLLTAYSPCADARSRTCEPSHPVPASRSTSFFLT